MKINNCSMLLVASLLATSGITSAASPEAEALAEGMALMNEFVATCGKFFRVRTKVTNEEYTKSEIWLEKMVIGEADKLNGIEYHYALKRTLDGAMRVYNKYFGWSTWFGDGMRPGVSIIVIKKNGRWQAESFGNYRPVSCSDGGL